MKYYFNGIPFEKKYFIHSLPTVLALCKSRCDIYKLYCKKSRKKKIISMKNETSFCLYCYEETGSEVYFEVLPLFSMFNLLDKKIK
jgi:hypothetical protein